MSIKRSLEIIDYRLSFFFNKMLSILNIHPDNNQKYILISILVSELMLAYTSPTIRKAIVSELPAEWIAIEMLTISATGLLIGMIWRGKLRKSAIKYFSILAISESTIGCALGMYLCFIHYNAWVFAITTLLYTNFISILVGKCIMAFRSKLWVDKDREVYDNNCSVVMSIVGIMGFAFALLCLPSLKLSLFLWAICCIIDDIGWIIVYFKNRETLKEIE